MEKGKAEKESVKYTIKKYKDDGRKVEKSRKDIIKEMKNKYQVK